NPEPWGVLALLDLAVELPRIGASAAAAASAYYDHGRFLVYAWFLGLALAQRVRPRWTALELGALALSGFLVVASGFGIQYTVYPVPFLSALRLRLAAVYGVAAGAFAAALYYVFWTGGSPWFSFFTTRYPPREALLGVLPWLLLLAFCVRTVERSLRSPAR